MAAICVAVSGGVDSACALLRLKNAGHELIAIHALLAPGSAPPCDLAQFCAQIDVPLEIIDLHAEFAKTVIEPYECGISSGLNPNPCAICNRKIKFGAMLERACELGANYLATGHYARLESSAGRLLFAPAEDQAKDQGYFLSLVRPKTLHRLVFPLAGLRKKSVRAILANSGFTFAEKAESQDVCFIERPALLGRGEAGAVLLRRPGEERRHTAELMRIGSHRGLDAYTVGQRQGLGITWREPLYVREKDAASNALVVAPRQMLFMRAVRVADLNFFLQFGEWPDTLLVRLRYRQPLCPARAELQGDSLVISLQEKRFATAPGQIAAIHDAKGRILAGGVVKEILF